MATSAFKSTTKRTPVGKSLNDSSSSNRSSSAHRRSRSLSRFSHRMPDQAEDFFNETPVPRGGFVNTVRGTGFPEISLDDLAIQVFSSGDRVRSASRNDEVNSGDKVSATQRRGRSVSRHSSRVGNVSGNGGNSYGRGKVNSESGARRRRSVSVVRYQISDSESDLDHSQNSSNHASSKNFTSGNNHIPLSNKAAPSNYRQGLTRSLSQKDLKYHDGYSSHSSALTDDEGRVAYSNKNGTEKTIRTAYTQKKTQHPSAIGKDMNNGLYEAMRSELRHAVEEIRMELEQAMGKTNTSALASDDHLQSRNSDALQAVSTIRRNYATKLERSEKRKQDLLAQIVLEGQRGRELSKIVKELLPDPKSTTVGKPLRARKKSNDRSRMSKRLTEEAEKYIEDFISNVEDTDISSLDGERSDTSSSIGGITRTETIQNPTISKSFPFEMDGVVLPWLQWETSNGLSPSSFKEPTTSKTNLWDVAQEANCAQDLSNYSVSSHGSWNPGVTDGHSTNIDEIIGSKFGEPGRYRSQFSLGGTRSQFDIDEYIKRQSDEDFLFETWKQQQRIHSGSLLLCNQMFFSL